MIVEFFGPAGVGKSTIATALRQRLTAQSIPNYTRKQLLQTAFPNLQLRRVTYLYRMLQKWQTRLVRPAQFAHLLRNMSHPTFTNYEQYKVVDWYLESAFEQRAFARTLKAPQVAVLDEGLAQKVAGVASIAAPTVNTATVNSLLTPLTPPALAIYVSASAAVCAQRMQARGVRPWHVASKTEAQYQQFIADQVTACDLIAQTAPTLGWHVLALDNTAPDQDGTQLNKLLDPVVAHLTEQLA